MTSKRVVPTGDLPKLPRVRIATFRPENAAAAGNTWLTPPEILNALGPFDLDPAAAPPPRPWPTATTMWTHIELPLHAVWAGRVWLSPPYEPRPVMTLFVKRMAEHDNGVLLLTARTETELWFEYVWPRADSILFLKGRPRFHYPNGERSEQNSGAPIALIAYGYGNTVALQRSKLAGQLVRLR